MYFKIVLFIRFCVAFAKSLCVQPEHLTTPKQEEIISLLEECLVVAIYLHDTQTQMKTYRILGDFYRYARQAAKAIPYYEKFLSFVTADHHIQLKPLKIQVYFYLVKCYESLGNYDKVVEYHLKILNIAKEIGNKDVEGDTYGNLANAHYATGKYNKAMEYYEMSLNAAKAIGDREREGFSYGGIGAVYHVLGRYHKAKEYYEKSNSIAKDIGDKEGEGATYGDLGRIYQSLAKYHKAIECHEKSLGIALKIGNRRQEGDAYTNLGITFRALGEYHKAIKYQEKSLGIANVIGNRRGEGLAYGNLGNCYRSLGEYHKTVECHEKSLTIAKDIGDRSGEETSYGNLGIAYEALGEYRKAIENHEKSLAIAKELGLKEREGHSYTNLGNVYQSLAEYHMAIECYQKSIKVAKEIDDKRGEGLSYISLGNVYRSLGEYHKSIEYNEMSLSITKEIGNKEGEGNSYGNLGLAYQLSGEHKKAIEYHEMSLDIAKEIGNKGGQQISYTGLGDVFFSLGQYHKAIESYENGLDIAKAIGDRQGQAIAHNHIGVCYDQDETSIKDLRKSREHLENSIECFDKMFDDLKEKDQFKISILERYINGYKVLSKVHVETGQTDEALLVCEHGRARALGDLLSYKYSTIKKSKLKSQSLQLTDIKNILSSCKSCILFYNLYVNKLIVAIWVIAPQTESIFMYDELAERKADLRTVFSDPLSKDERESVQNEHFQNLVENSFQYMNVREGMKCEDRSLESLECEDKDKGFSKTDPHPNRTPMETESWRWLINEECDEDDMPLSTLFDRLVSPVVDKLTQDEIIIIPDGPLFKLPFAALQDPKTGRFLSETKRIRMAPSLTTLKILQESSDVHHYKSGALIIGNPATGKVMYKGKERSITFLQGAEDEAKEIGKLLGVQPLIGEQATKQRVLAELKQGVSVIHFAAHGSEKNGQIFLAPSEPSSTHAIPEEEDYILTMKEAQESGIRAQLVVLSCCHSGRGEIKSEGVVGMARAFLAAGARAVVASLWAIADDATMLFMVKFYSHLKKGDSASTSLHKAMKEMREIETYKEPKYWAAFFLIGDDVTINV